MAQQNWFMPDTALQRQQNGTACLWKSWLKSAAGCSFPKPSRVAEMEHGDDYV